MGGLDAIVRELAEVLPQLQRLLGSQRLDVGHPHVCDDAQFLFLGFCFRLFELLVKNLSIQAQLSAQHDVLLNEKPFLAPVKRPASDLFTGARKGFRSEEHTSELQSHSDLVCRLLLEKKKHNHQPPPHRHPGRRYLLKKSNESKTFGL